jgi:transcriptional regulator NrdR family protein
MEPFAKSRPKSPAHQISRRKMCQPKVNYRINTFQNLEKEAQRYENGWLLIGGK